MAATKNKTKNLSATSIRKIRRMIAAVLAEPEFYDQNTFGDAIRKDSPACETVCCAAGWAIWLENSSIYDKLITNELKPNGYVGHSTWARLAKKSLDLSPSRKFNSHVLFGNSEQWPEPFCDDYLCVNTPKDRAKVFAARWEKFIESDGKI